MARSNQKMEVHLTDAQRTQLKALCRQGNASAATHRRGRILLLSDQDHVDGRRPDWQIAQIVGLSLRQVVRVRQQFVRQGIDGTLTRKARLQPGMTPKFDGESEAKLVVLCCSTPPEGRQRWTLELLVDELCRLQVVTSVCRETVRLCLKKTASSRGNANAFVFPKKTAPVSWLTWRKSSTSTRNRSIATTR